MKKLLFSLIAVATLFTACVPDPIEPIDNRTYIISDVNIGGQTFKKLEGNINENLVLPNSEKWVLSGGVFVEDGFTLSILDGQTI